MPLPKMNCYYDDDVVSSATRGWGGGAIYGSPPDPGVYFRVMHRLRPGIYLRSDVDIKFVDSGRKTKTLNDPENYERFH
ncbi:zn-dependent glyoxylase [Lasius niger]|uniref:Zn-dependent glyoxylase n=1 Tax=Lasius niger TaxID=67767 RepID=A0A0J7KY55_LASNI|nr:zn-dependent glyoxylase [Lasius niger]